MALQESASHGQPGDNALLAVTTLNFHAFRADNPEVPMVKDSDVHLAIKDVDVWISPQHACALLAAGWASSVHGTGCRGVLIGVHAVQHQVFLPLQLGATGQQAMVVPH